LFVSFYACNRPNTDIALLHICRKDWCIKLQETIGPNHVLAHSVSHGVLHLVVFIRRDLIWHCTSEYFAGLDAFTMETKSHTVRTFMCLSAVTCNIIEAQWYSIDQCFSTFLLQRNLLQMFPLLMVHYAMTQVCALLQPHRTVVGNYVPDKFDLFRGPLVATRGTLVEKHWYR